MLTIFFGTDTDTVRRTAHVFVEDRASAGMRVSRLEASTYEVGMLQNALGAMSLFGDREIWVIDSPEELDTLQAEVAQLRVELAAAASEFVIITYALSAAEKKAYEKAGASLRESSAAAAPRENMFALTEALARRDKKSLWLLYIEAVKRGKSAEELIGLLWWQLKALRLAASTKSAREAGMKDFPYQKAKQALRNFKPGELETLSTSLLTVYHEGHSGLQDIDLALEAWVLSS